MRPVAGTLGALRAAPMRGELAGEASARAAFRQIMLAGESEPAWSAGPAGDARTLILPERVTGGGPHAVTRPRHSHRRPRRRGRWHSKALAGAAAGAAAVVVVGGIALAGGFSGAAGHPGQPGQSLGAASSTTQAGQSGSGSRGLEGNATKEATPRATAASGAGQSSSGSGASVRSTLCRQYWAFFAHSESSASWTAEKGDLRQLSKLAGSPWNVSRYCMPYYSWGFAPPAPATDHGDGPGDGPGPQGPGDSQGENLPGPRSGSDDGGSDGNSGNGDSGSHGGNGPHGVSGGLGNSGPNP
jgi:hypothetical protein